MMTSDLPADLVEEILSRVPATSLKRLRSTCTQWNALFKNKGFTEKHFRKAAKQSMVLLLKNYRVCPMNVNLNVSPLSVEEFNGELSLKDSHSTIELEVDIDIVFHCDGLMLCNTKDNRLVVWNPCLGETRWIQLKTDYKIYTSTFSLGYINNNKSCRSYKILRCWDSYELNHHVLKYEVYEFSTDSWRGFDNFVSLNHVIHRDTCVSLKGNTYWLSFYKETHFLLCFDYTTDRFKPMCLPPIQNYPHVFLSVVREEKLSVLDMNYHSAKMEIWMAKNIDIEATMSWRKSFTVETHSFTCVYPFCHSFLLDEEKRLLVCCYESYFNNIVEIFGEDHNKYYKNYSYCKSGSWSHSRPYIFNYVPSLVQIQREVEEAKEK